MSNNLIANYEKEFADQVAQLKEMLQEPSRMNVYFKASQDPKEYAQA